MRLHRSGVVLVNYVVVDFFWGAFDRHAANDSLDRAFGCHAVRVDLVSGPCDLKGSDLGVYIGAALVGRADHYDVLRRIRAYGVFRSFLPRFSGRRHDDRHDDRGFGSVHVEATAR